MRSFKAASSTLSPSCMSMARLAFPSRLELNRPEGSFNVAPLGNVILTTFLYVSPVQTMPPWDQMGVPIHFHSSTISGSASRMISRTFASVFPRQSPSSLIFSLINAEASIEAEADFIAATLFIFSSNSRTQYRCAQRDPQHPLAKGGDSTLIFPEARCVAGRSLRARSLRALRCERLRRGLHWPLAMARGKLIVI